VVIVTLTTRPADHRLHGHEHAVDLRDNFDFLNTLTLEEGSWVDHLGTAEDALRWIADHQLIHAEPANGLLDTYRRDRRRGARDLHRVRHVREALREVSDAVVEARPADDEALAEVNRVLRHRPIPRLSSMPNGVAVGHGHESDPLDDAFARLAEPLVREIATGRPDRLRVCDNDRCRWVFYDTSPTGRRRWCDMASCGNRAKAARHRARTRSADPRTRRARRAPSPERSS
jgi:predicted RNA-binding Zn ribbon-like protein